VFELSKQKYSAASTGQLSDGGIQFFGSKIIGRLNRVVVALFIERYPTAFRFQTAQRMMQNNRLNPSTQRAFKSKTGQISKNLHKRILQHIMGVVGIVQNPKGLGIHGSFVPLKQQALGLAVSAETSFNKLRFGYID